MTETKKRKNAIKSLIENEVIHTHEELQNKLQNMGFTVTQSTISRDIISLGVIKVLGAYVLPEMLPRSENSSSRLSNRILQVKTAGENLIVLRTNPGEAGSVGLTLDDASWPTIVGTVAGDDTIFVACGDKEDQKDILQRLNELVPNAF